MENAGELSRDFAIRRTCALAWGWLRYASTLRKDGIGECFCHRFAHIAWSRGRGSWLRPPSQIQHLKKAHSFAVSSGSHALRTYTDDAGVPLAAAGRTLRGHAARTACVCRCLWGHLKMRGFVRVGPGGLEPPTRPL